MVIEGVVGAYGNVADETSGHPGAGSISYCRTPASGRGRAA